MKGDSKVWKRDPQGANSLRQRRANKQDKIVKQIPLELSFHPAHLGKFHGKVLGLKFGGKSASWNKNIK